jgi:hypothetical protein
MVQDPRHAGPTPPQPEQQQKQPGHTAEMTPKPDHGEESCKGSGKLQGSAEITGGGLRHWSGGRHRLRPKAPIF